MTWSGWSATAARALVVPVEVAREQHHRLVAVVVEAAEVGLGAEVARHRNVAKS
jgi:hypothetical protein